jgi:hypothetical protein
MRREGLSLTRAAAQAGTTPNTAWRYAGGALQRRQDGRIVARRADRLYRHMRVFTIEGPKAIGVRGSRVASVVGAHASASQHFLATGDDSRLQTFKGKRVGGLLLETDPDVIEAWARRGALDFEAIYELTT